MVAWERRSAYVAVWVLALAFGVIEGSVAVYLREIYVRDAAIAVSSRIPSLEVTLVSLPDPLVMLEMVREACTIALLAALGWLSGRRFADRAGAFLLAFGIWDLTYYALLRVVLGWPTTVGAWDVLFLIPTPWVAPVWAPATVAVVFVVAGSYLFWTPDAERRYSVLDAAILIAATLLTLASFLVETQAAIVHRVPARYATWLFWPGVAAGTLWFVHVERRRTQPGGSG
jgi:hypothetical protein